MGAETRMHLKRRSNKKLASLGAAALILVGCQTTSDVTTIGPDTYRVGAAACPACGGTSQALEMASNRASEFCAEQGKTALELDSESRNLNAVGAGASSVDFRCIETVEDDQIQACYDDAISATMAEFGEAEATELFTKIAQYDSFTQLSDQSYPTDLQQTMIKKWGADVEQCERMTISMMRPEVAEIREVNLTSQLTALAQLSNADVTFAQFSEKMNEADAVQTAAFSEKRIADAEAARWEREQSMRTMENLNREIQRTIDQTGNN